MSLPIEDCLVAQGRVDAAASPAWLNRRGFSGAAPTRNGAGDYTLTLTEGVDATNIQVFVTLEKATVGFAGYTIVSDTQIRIYTFDGTPAAADTDFSILVLRIP
jgi:hypothetical protein